MLLTSLPTFLVLLTSFVATLFLAMIINKKIAPSQLRTSFLLTLICLLICDIGLLFQIVLSPKYNINPIYFDYFVYIGTCFLPVCLFFTSTVFTKTKIKLKRIYIFLVIIPIISLILLWTNDFHHLFYKTYSVYLNDTVSGPYMIIHSLYSYGLLILSILNLIKLDLIGLKLIKNILQNILNILKILIFYN